MSFETDSLSGKRFGIPQTELEAVQCTAHLALLKGPARSQ